MATILQQNTATPPTENLGKVSEQTENEKNIAKSKSDPSVDQGKKFLKKTLKDMNRLNRAVGGQNNNLSPEQIQKFYVEGIEDVKTLIKMTHLEDLVIAGTEDIVIPGEENMVYRQSNQDALERIALGQDSAVDLAKNVYNRIVSPSVLFDLERMEPTSSMSKKDISLATLMAWVMLILIDLEKETAAASLQSSLVQAKAIIRLVALAAKNAIAAAEDRRNAAVAAAAAGAVETIAGGVMQVGGGYAGLFVGAGLAIIAAVGKGAAGYLEYEAALKSATVEVQRSSSGTISQEEGNEQQKFSALLSRLVDDLGALVQQYAAVINALNG